MIFDYVQYPQCVSVAKLPRVGMINRVPVIRYGHLEDMRPRQVLNLSQTGAIRSIFSTPPEFLADLSSLVTIHQYCTDVCAVYTSENLLVHWYNEDHEKVCFSLSISFQTALRLT